MNYTTYELRVLKTTVGIHITLSCGNGIKHTLCRYFVLEQLPVAIEVDQCVPGNIHTLETNSSNGLALFSGSLVAQ